MSNLVRKPLKPGFLTTQLKLNIALLNLNHAHFSFFSGKRELHRSKTLPIIHPPKLIPNDNETTETVASGFGQGQGPAQRKTSVPIIMCLQRRIKTSPGTTLTGTVKFLNFRTPEYFAVNYLKFKQRGQTLGNFDKKMQME